MITGSNTNVRHRGKLFHVQTEDSGKRNPHVISHVYFGGTILASEKTSYAERLDLESDGLDKDVKGLIEEQHRAMVQRLKRGDFDAVIDRCLSGSGAAGLEPADTAATTPQPEAGPPTPPPVTEPTLDEPESAPASSSGPAASRGFGEGLVSQKPLDEVILDYLVEKARDRARGRDESPAARSRKKG